MRKTKRAIPTIDALDFEGGQAVVVEPDDGGPDPRWTAWHIRTDDVAGGWVRGDWLQSVEQGFAFGDETAIEGLNFWTDPNFGIMFERPSIGCALFAEHAACNGLAERVDGSAHPCGCRCHILAA